MAKKETSTSAKITFDLDASVLETLKKISSNAFASAAYAAAVNQDFLSLVQVSNYLLGVADGRSNAITLSGDSLFAAEVQASAQMTLKDGRIKEKKRKGHLLPILLEPIAGVSREEIKGNKVIGDYAQSLRSLVRLSGGLKIPSEAIAEALSIALKSPQDVLFSTLAPAFVEHIGAQDLLEQIQIHQGNHQDFQGHDGKEAAVSSSSGRVDEILRLALESPAFRAGFVQWIEQLAQDANCWVPRPIERPIFNPLLALSRSQWPDDHEVYEILCDAHAIEAIVELRMRDDPLGIARLPVNERSRHHVFLDRTTRNLYPDPIDEGGKPLDSAVDYLARYAQIRSHVMPEYVSRAAHQALRNSDAPEDLWQAIKPLQDKVERDRKEHPEVMSATDIWPGMFCDHGVQPSLALLQHILAERQIQPKGASQALASMARCLQRDPQRADALMPTLLAAGGNPEAVTSTSFNPATTPKVVAALRAVGAKQLTAKEEEAPYRPHGGIKLSA